MPPGPRTSPTRSPSWSSPEYVARSWWERILYNQAAKRLRTVLLGRPHTVVVAVPYRREDPEPCRRPKAADRPTGSRRDGGIVTAAHGRYHTPAFRRAVLALNGGPSDARIVRLAAELAKPSKAELVAVHVVEIDWTLPLDADIAGRSEEVQRVLDLAEEVAEESKQPCEPVCSRPGTWAPRSSTRRSSAAPT